MKMYSEKIRKYLFLERSYEFIKIILILLTSVIFLKSFSSDHYIIKSFVITITSFLPLVGIGVYFVPLIILNLFEMNYLNVVIYSVLLIMIVCIEKLVYNVFYDKTIDYSSIFYILGSILLYLFLGKYALLIFSLIIYGLMIYNNYNKIKKHGQIFEKSKLNIIDIKDVFKGVD